MSWVEDARKLLQDFVAPELRGINQRIDDVLLNLKSSFENLQQLQAERDKALDQRLEAAGKATEQRLLAAERASEQRFQAADRASEQRFQAAGRASEQRFQAAERASEQRYIALLERIEASRRELSLQISLALATKRIEELERNQQGSRTGEQSPQATV